MTVRYRDVRDRFESPSDRKLYREILRPQKYRTIVFRRVASHHSLVARARQQVRRI